MPSKMLYSHQQKIIELNPHRFLLAHATGTGKTITAIRLAEKNSDNALVICPKSIKKQWQEQIKRFGEKKIKWQILSKEEFRKLWKNLERYDCIIYDEFHFFANATSQLHRAAYNYSKRHNPTYIYGLTATPYLSSMMNLYAEERLLGRKPSWHEYQLKYFQQVRMGSRLIPLQKPHLEKEAASIIKKMGDVVKLDDCIDLPEQIFETEYFDLTKEQYKAIKELNEIVPIVKWTKTHQLCGGSLKGDGYTKDTYFENNKIPRLLEICQQHDRIVIVCRYNLEVDRIYEAITQNLPHQAVKITGKVKDRHEELVRANNAEKSIIIVNAACSCGWEAPDFGLMVFYSYDFSLVNYLQMIGLTLL
ncbi:MAG: DEAD/DEAH box helicase family protein, partial [Actinobacteria bacterium]|nr:DEAD/DEAH box helicase family protein [Actinomycetota bacterium]